MLKGFKVLASSPTAGWDVLEDLGLDWLHLPATRTLGYDPATFVLLAVVVVQLELVVLDRICPIR